MTGRGWAEGEWMTGGRTMVSTERHRKRQRLLVGTDADAPRFTRILVSVPGRGGSPLAPRLH